MEQVEAWKDACLQANGGVAQEGLQKELKQNERENRNLQEELDIKERVLGEAAALLVLRKKPVRFGGTARTPDLCLKSQDSNRTDR